MQQTSDLERSMTRARNWSQDPYLDQADRDQVNKLLDNNNQTEIIDAFYRDLEFGTGGLRAVMGVGTNRMNKYNIRRATQALAQQVLALAKSKGDTVAKIAIGYDSRHNSAFFASEVACVMAGNGVHAFLFEYLVPVPLVSYSVRMHHAHAGVMVTASHNPPAYNGYKVYWDDGAQVIPPYDKQIINTYNSLASFSQVKYMPLDQALKNNLITMVGKNVEDSYFEMLKTKSIDPGMCQERGRELKIVYTPIHGAGLLPCLRALHELGFNEVMVPAQQREPNGAFPTVKSPNPENPDALKMAVDLMKEYQADLVFGTDPDCDRLGVALLHRGEVFYPNGNQLGLLMLHYVLSRLKENNRLPAKGYFIKTIVTSELQATVAKAFGVEVHNTLTGFKWICGLMRELDQKHPEKKFIFATEESFGYMTHNNVRDKDGICSVAMMAELALWYKTRGMNLVQALDSIYEQYGFSDETLLSLDFEGKAGAEKINRIMDHFRHSFNQDLDGEKVLAVEDYQAGVILSKGEKIPLTLPKSNVLGYALASGNKLYLRPSGTEPKIKFYLLIQCREGTLLQKKATAKAIVDKLLSFIRRQAEMA